MSLPVLQNYKLSDYGLNPRAPEAIDSSMLKVKAERILALSVRRDDCLIWTKGKSNTGYGMIWHNTKMITVHSVICAYYYGPRPVGMDICHSCGHRGCVEPMHLRYASRADNMADCKQYGMRLGRSAAFTDDDVIVLQACLSKGLTQTAIANALGFSQSTISRAVRRSV